MNWRRLKIKECTSPEAKLEKRWLHYELQNTPFNLYYTCYQFPWYTVQNAPGGSGCSQKYCPSCSQVKNAPYFITVSIADQLKLFLKRKFLWCMHILWYSVQAYPIPDIAIVRAYLFLLQQHWQNKNLNILAGQILKTLAYTQFSLLGRWFSLCIKFFLFCQ